MADAPTPPPLRVVVLGASATVETSFRGGPRADVAYPRVLEAELVAAGVPARVRAHAIPAHRLRHGRGAWETEVAAVAPDVVVVHYGQADSVHLFLPRWLERHANSQTARPGPVRDRYRRLVLRPVWVYLARFQQWLDGKLDATRGGTRPRRRQQRLGVELARLLELRRTVGRPDGSPPLVLVPTLVRPGPPWQRWFPGAAARMAALNDVFRDVVAAADDPDVRVFPLAALVEAGLPQGDEPTPDGGHFTPEVHQLVGAALAEEILEWQAGDGRSRGCTQHPLDASGPGRI